MAKSISQKVQVAAKENAQALFEDMRAGAKTSVRMAQLEKDLKRGLSAEQLGLSKHELAEIARHA